MIELIDTHCHIQEARGLHDGECSINSIWQRDGDLKVDNIILKASEEGVKHLICVGTTLADSTAAAEFASPRTNVWASVGVHPHEAKDYVNSPNKLHKIRNLLEKDKVVAIGECGLDYHYEHSAKADQRKLLRFHLELAAEYDLPLILHIREAFDDFWHIFDEYNPPLAVSRKRIRGVVHSFSSTKDDLHQILARGLYVGLNGIMTFTKDKRHLEAAKAVPLQKLLLETDAPFLTPAPFRGTICQPKHVRVTAEFLSQLRDESLDDLSAATTTNAKELFRLNEHK